VGKDDEEIVRETITILDTTPVTTEITKLSTGTTEQALLAAVARAFPELAPAELSQALQVTTAAAERRITARRCRTADFKLSTMIFDGTPPNTLNACSWQERKCSIVCETVNSTYISRL
jgi:hypothetical protein